MCEELKTLKREAVYVCRKVKTIRRSKDLSFYEDAELNREKHESLNTVLKHLLVGHEGKPCPAGDRPIVSLASRRGVGDSLSFSFYASYCLAFFSARNIRFWPRPRSRVPFFQMMTRDEDLAYVASPRQQ